MTELLQVIHEISLYLSGDIFNAIFILLGVVLLVMIGFIVKRIGATEVGRQVIDIWKLIDDHIYNTAISIAFADRYDVTKASIIAADYKKRFGGAMLDIRLAYVVKAVEIEIEKHSQIDFDFFYVLNKVEGIYQSRVKTPRS